MKTNVIKKIIIISVITALAIISLYFFIQDHNGLLKWFCLIFPGNAILIIKILKSNKSNT